MRRRPPQLITLSSADCAELERVLRDGRREQRVARRARVLLAMNEAETVIADLARQVHQTPTAIWYICRRYEARGLEAIYDAPRAGRPPDLSALERVEIEQLACCAPAGVGLHMTHWSTRSLAQAARDHLHRATLAHSTVSLILREADLQPHRSRYWKTPTLNAQFRERASRILGCYEQVVNLHARGEQVICLDEKPNIQALERAAPTQPMRAGQIERQEFEYHRHGIVNFLTELNVYDGHMAGWCLDANDSQHLCPILKKVFKRHDRAARLHLIWDNGPSHISQTTQDFLRDYQPWLRVLFTPAHASWLNQAELLLRAFGSQYLKRGDWSSRQALIDHLLVSYPEYNQQFAHPFDWLWTRRDMDKWIERCTTGLS
jgi:DDE superfamily endonuclease/Homeodomain-like domain